ncbi:alpha/beta hydrolase [Xylariaceae sp. FL1651]|nr:alpha/beta hydrolase [Xylariaceae sp. FL1651]
MHRFSGSKFFDFELIRLLGSTWPCAIRKHDPESWQAAWSEQSQRAEKIAREAVESGQIAAARRAFLRSANYARASGYMLIGPDARILESAERSVSLFREAILYMECQVVGLEIPYHYEVEDRAVILTGYLYLPPPSKRLPGKKIPVLINCGGADFKKEELYFALPAAAAELGYAVVTFDGSGQGITLKRDKVPLRPDFEALAAPQRDLNLDLSRVRIAGASMGAYYSLKGCSTSYQSIRDIVKIRACIAIDGFYSLWDVAMERIPVQLGMASDFPTQWEMLLGMSMTGTKTPGDTPRRFRLFSLNAEIAQPGGKARRIADSVHCPVLLTGASSAIYASIDDGTIAVYNALKYVPNHCKVMWTPSEPGNGGLTGKVSAWQLLA